MPFKFFTLAGTIAALFLSGCASSGGSATRGAGNTTYSQYQGYTPIPDFGAADPGGARISY